MISLLSLLSPSVDPRQFWPIAFLGLVFPYLILANLFFIALWYFVEKKKILLSLACMVLLSFQLGGIVQVNWKKKNKGITDIRCMSYNIKHGVLAYDRDSKKRKKGAQLFEEHLDAILPKPEILCIQEAGPFGKELIQRSFGNYYVHTLAQRGTAIYSRFPIVNSGQVDFGTKTNSCLWADIVAHLDTVRVYSAHLQSNQISKEAEKLAANADIQSQETWSSIRWILGKYKNKNQRRSEQVKQLVEHIKRSPYPVIMGIDLNDHPQSFIYRELHNELQDSFRKTGNGLGTTFAGNIPLLRIDYLMFSDQFEIVDHHVVKPTMSDHYPILSSVILK